MKSTDVKTKKQVNCTACFKIL